MDQASATDLLEVLSARQGLICAVGAGGKKSTLYRLAQAHHLLGSARVGMTATVTVAAPPAHLFGEPLVGRDDILSQGLPAALRERRLIAFAAPSSKPARLGGLAPDTVAKLHHRFGFTATLVKADGARMRLIKAPDELEPVLPPGPLTLLPVVSAQAIGRPLDSTIAHRLERLSQVTGAAPGEPITTSHVARLLVSDAGALHHAGTNTVVPIINMVDDSTRHDAARAVARLALAMTGRFDRIVLAAMNSDQPLVEVIERSPKD